MLSPAPLVPARRRSPRAVLAAAGCRLGRHRGVARAARARDRAGGGLPSRHARPPALGGYQLDSGPRGALPARRRWPQRLPDPADRPALDRIAGLLRPAPAGGSRGPLLPHARHRRDGDARRVHRSGPPALRPLLRPDADPVLLPHRDIRRREPDRGDDEDDRLHAGRLAADAGRGDRHRRNRLRRHRPPDLLIGGAQGPSAVARQPGMDLLLLRRGLPDQDAVLPRPWLDARRLPGGAAAGAGAAFGCAAEGGRLRVPAGGAAAVPGGNGPLPGDGDADRAGLDPLRLGDGVHADERAPDRRLLIGRAAGLHNARDLLAAHRAGPTGRSCRWSLTAWSSRRSS